MDHSPREEDEDLDRRDSRRDKFKRERDDERGLSPHRRGSPSRRNDLRGPHGRSRSRSRSRSRERFPPGRGGPGFGRRESPPFKRHKREDEWDDRSPPRYRDDRRRYDDYDYDRRDDWRTPRGKGARTTAALFDGPMLTYKQFLEIQDEGISPNEAERRYDDYQVEYKRRQAKSFFNEHKTDEWFKEKYEPTYLEQKRLEKITTSQSSAKSFAQALQEGTIDFNITATLEDINKHMASKPEEPKEETEDQQQTEDQEKSEKIPDEKSEKIPEEKSEKIPEEKSESSLTGSTSITEPTSVFIKVVPSHISRQSILDLFKKTSGFRRLTLSEPQRFKNFNRLGWATYDTYENCVSALKELQGNARIGEFELQLAINKTPDVHKLPKITPPVASEESRIAVDLEQIRVLAMQLDKEKSIDSNPLFSSDITSSLSTAEQLDRVIVYLRKVHFYCYYCGEEYDDEDDLIRKCIKHLRGRRREDSTGEVSTDPWAVSLDTKIKNRINHTDNPDSYTAKSKIEQKTEKFYSKNTLKIEADKYRCALCSKLFMGEQFVRKHIVLKHPEPIGEVKVKAIEKQFFENYFNDPKRITPGPVGPMPMMGRTPPGRGRGGWSGGNFSPQSYNSPMNSPNYRGGRGRKPFTPRSGGYGGKQQSPMEPPPGMSMDPRALKEYVDLDAPSEDVVQIDYRIGDLKKRKKQNTEQANTNTENK